MAFYQALSWHPGEDKIHEMVRVPQADNPTHPMLSQNAARRVAASPTIALGTVDDEDNVWCTIWGGDLPIAQQVAAGGVIGVKAHVDASFDPVVQVLYGGKDDGEIMKSERQSARMVSGLSIHLEDRDRVKLFGKMVAGCLDADTGAEDSVTQDEKAFAPQEGKKGKTGMAQLVLHITQSLGNCPKYINKRTIASHPSSRPQLISDQPRLSTEAISHVHSCDVFFVASRGPEDMDCNHRGGTSGFLRVQPQATDDVGPSVLVWPEYSGNNLYQTLGNIIHTPKVGLCVPNFVTGDVLYLSGTAEVLLDRAATSIISKTKLAVHFTVTASRFVKQGLMFRGTPCSDNKDKSSSNPATTRPITDGMSPYNPRVRYLTSELDPSTNITDKLPPDEYRDRSSRPSATLTASLIRKTKITPTITRYRFRLTSSDPHAFDPNMSPLWQPSQYIALDFSDELYMGYSHMRDDEPTSLNDDFVRTFTVASKYTSSPGSAQPPEFEIVIRNVGVVTRWLSQQNDRAGMTELGVLGFGGGFGFGMSVEGEHNSQGTVLGGEKSRNVFIAAGIGITPLLGQIAPGGANSGGEEGGVGRMETLTLLWTLGVRDINLVLDVLPSVPPALKANTTIFVTGTQSEDEDGANMQSLKRLEGDIQGSGQVKVYRRRMMRDDVAGLEDRDVDEGGKGSGKGKGKVANWYVCTASAMRKEIQSWLGGRSIIFENFDY